MRSFRSRDRPVLAVFIRKAKRGNLSACCQNDTKRGSLKNKIYIIIMSTFNVITPRIFSDERLYSLDPSYKWIFAFVIGGLNATALSEIGIYEIGRGEIATATNIEMEKTEEIINFFHTQRPELVEYDTEKHMIFVKSMFKYKLTHGALTLGKSVCAAVHKDFKRYGKKAPRFFAEFVHKYHQELEESIKSVSTKDNNYLSWKKTFNLLFDLEKLYFHSLEDKKNVEEKLNEKPSSDISKVCALKMSKDLAQIFSYHI